MKKYIIAVVATIVASVAVVIALYVTDTHMVSLNTKDGTFVVYQGDTAITSAAASHSLELREGEYCVRAAGDDYTDKRQCFTVYKEDVALDFDFDYSTARLESLLDDAWSDIATTTTSAYHTIIDSYTICRGVLYKKGDWYAGIIREKIAVASDTGDYYRMVMKKDGDAWTIVASPSAVVSRHTDSTKDIPADVVDAANTLTPCPAEVGLNQPIPDTTVRPERQRFMPHD